MSILIERVTKKYGRQLALNNISFKVDTGEILGLIGPNGAGKTTLMKILCGLIFPDSGKILINDISVQENSLEIRKDLGYLPENNPLYQDMYIMEYLEFIAGIYKLGKKSKERINSIIEQTGLRPEINKRVEQLSKGYKQRVGLAQALLHNPRILILDEPTSGLDPNQIIEIRDLISKVGKEKTIILSTHIMQEVEAICDRVIIINKGEIVADDIPSNLKTSSSEKFQTIIVEFDKTVEENDLMSVKGVNEVKKVNNNNWIVQSSVDHDVRPGIFKLAVKNNLTVLSLQKKDKKLEDVFRELTTK